MSIQMQELKKLGLLPNPHMSDENERSVSGIGEGMILPVARIRKICRLDPEVRGMSKGEILGVRGFGQLSFLGLFLKLYSLSWSYSPSRTFFFFSF